MPITANDRDRNVPVSERVASFASCARLAQARAARVQVTQSQEIEIRQEGLDRRLLPLRIVFAVVQQQLRLAISVDLRMTHEVQNMRPIIADGLLEIRDALRSGDDLHFELALATLEDLLDYGTLLFRP